MRILNRSSLGFIALFVLIVLSLVTFATIAFLPTDWSLYNDAEWPAERLESVTVVRYEVRAILSYVGAACFFALMAVAAIVALRRRFIVAGVAFTVTFACPLAGAVSLIRNLAPWQIYNEIEGPDGVVYCFMESSFLQGQTLALARLRSDDSYTRTVDILVTTNGDNPRTYLCMIRPAGAEERYGQLYLVENRYLVGIRYENRCYFVCDVKANKVYGRDAVEGLSPFLCLGATTVPHEPDVDKMVAAGLEKERGSPKRSAVEAAMAHPNPRVRDIVARLIDNAGK